MRTLFPGYYRPSEDEFGDMWGRATFVFDANVLLNMYSYPESVREVFFSVLEKVIDRSWIPYQVALEFHRNRTGRIKQSNKKIEQLLDLVKKTGSDLQTELNKIEFEKRNTGIDDIDERLAAVHKSHQSLSDAIQKACNKLPVVTLDESIGLRIADLFEGKVGVPPGSQEALSEIVKDGDNRYARKIPPGFEDAKKGGEFRDGDISYQDKFGDLILWRQLINHINSPDVDLESVIFVTGDGKADWWLIDDGKTIGPLPELVQEILQKSKLKKFWMYSADQFLKYAETYLGATEVTIEAIEQVKETSTTNSDFRSSRDLLDAVKVWRGDFIKNMPTEKSEGGIVSGNDIFGIRNLWAGTSDPLSVHRAMFEAMEMWLIDEVDEGDIQQPYFFPRYIVTKGAVKSAYEFVCLDSLDDMSSLKKIFKMGSSAVLKKMADDFSVVICIPEINFDGPENSSAHKFGMFVKKLKDSWGVRSLVLGIYMNGKFCQVLRMD